MSLFYAIQITKFYSLNDCLINHPFFTYSATPVKEIIDDCEEIINAAQVVISETNDMLANGKSFSRFHYDLINVHHKHKLVLTNMLSTVLPLTYSKNHNTEASQNMAVQDTMLFKIFD